MVSYICRTTTTFRLNRSETLTVKWTFDVFSPKYRIVIFLKLTDKCFLLVGPNITVSISKNWREINVKQILDEHNRQ